MKTMLVSAVFAAFVIPAVAGEVPIVTVTPHDSSTGVATAMATAEAAATVTTKKIASTGDTSPLQSTPSISAYGGGCDHGPAKTEAMLIN